MDIERYRRAQSIFDEVVDLDPVSRAAAVDVACGPDTALRTLVSELLELDEQDSPLDDAAPVLAADLARSMGIGDNLKPGVEVDRYIVESLLGTGGTARVWAVRHRTLSTRHALKVLSWSDDNLTKRLLREARVQAALQHRNIVPVRDVIEVEGVPALLMPLIDGPPLDILLRHVSPTVDEAAWLIHEVVAGVAHAHERGLIHRDIKSANVLLELTDDQIIPKVTDFGLVKATDAQTLTRPGDIMCTLASAAPEQLADPSRVDQRADIWSLGVVAYHIATGKRPFPGDTLQAVVDAHLAGPDLEAVPPALRPMVAAALVADPTARASSATALHALLPAMAPHPPTERLARLARQLRDGQPLDTPDPTPQSTLSPKPDWTPPTLNPAAPTPRAGLQPAAVFGIFVALTILAAATAYFGGP